MPSFRAQSRNPPCTLFFLAPFAEGFQFYFVTHTTLYRCARKIEDFARDDVAEMAFSKHIRCTLREINPFPHTVISSAVEKSSLHAVFPCPFRGRLPILLCHTYNAISVCKKDRGLRSGWRCGNGVFQTYPLYATWNKPIPPYRHFERSEKSSLHSALSCSFRKSFPLFRYHTYGAIPVCKKDRGLRSGWRYGNSVFSAHSLYDA